MVYINDKKYACESCIKGHRSSSCRHNDRPLFEIKKKGRPVSQCETCRTLRKTKRVHGKCLCNTPTSNDSDGNLGGSSRPAKKKDPSVKPKRFVPIIPSLPNGLKDAAPTENLGPSDPRQQVETLLNPCHCKDVWSCNCRSSPSSSATSGSPTPPSVSNGLAALAQAAALCCSTEVIAPRASASAVGCCAPGPTPSKKRTQDGRRSPTPPGIAMDPKRHKARAGSCCAPRHSRSPSVQKQQHPERGPELAPFLPSSHPALDAADLALASPALRAPMFPVIPPLNAVASLAGTGCACGFECACPGCVEHRGAEHAAGDHGDCPDGCGTCVDREGGLELPIARARATPSSSLSSSSSNLSIKLRNSALDQFFAQAAALPRPPVGRGRFDPADTRTYPTDLFGEGSGLNTDEAARRAAFGLGVRLPKLDCCGGRCGCPGDTCACGQACDGCCAEHHTEEQTEAAAADDMVDVVQTPRKSCCAV